MGAWLYGSDAAPPSGAGDAKAQAVAAVIRPRLSRGIRGLLFELVGVLHDDTLWQRWLWRVLRNLGLKAEYCGFFRIWQRDFLADVQAGRRGFCQALKAFLFSVGLSAAQVDEVEAACQARRRLLSSGIRPFPGVKATLGCLRRSGLVLGVLTDSEHPAALLQQQLQQCDLADVLATVVSSLDLGRTMPDPLCYRTALAAMKLPAAEVAFVGHGPEALFGAAALGMPTVAFNFDPEAQADVYLERFEELLDVAGAPEPLAAAG